MAAGGLVFRYGKLHEVLIHNESGIAIESLRVGIRYGGSTISALKAGEVAKTRFLDNGEGSYTVTYPYGAAESTARTCGYSGVLPGRTAKLLVRITATSIECESSH